MQNIGEVLKEYSLDLSPEFNNEWIKNGAQWFKGKVLSSGIKCAFYGDFSRGLSQYWVGAENLTKEQKAELDEEIKKARQENRAEQERRWAQVRPEVDAEFRGFKSEGSADYFVRRGLDASATHGSGIVYEESHYGTRAIVPARDAEGVLWGYQRIYPDKLPDVGTDKIFRKGARKEGCFHTLGDLEDGRPIYLAEGIATALTIWLALNRSHSCVSCFDAGNIMPVARSLRSKYPNSRIVFCADDDRYPAKDGKIYHTGCRKADDACQEVGNGGVILPQFKDYSTCPTDFDDARQLEGLERVAEMLAPSAGEAGGQSSSGDSEPSDKGAGDNEDGPTPEKEEAKVKKIGEARAVKILLNEYGSSIVKMDKDVFLFKDTHWHHLEPDAARDFFGKRLDAIAKGLWKFREITSAYGRFLMHMPAPPNGLDMFSPRPDCINLQNGTIHVKQGQDRQVKMVFSPHQASDYLINILPFKYEPSDTHHNVELTKALEVIFKDEPDYQEKFYGVQEMYGSTICGLFPMLFMLYGQPGTGKSTIANVARRMAGRKNICSVPPTRWNNFHMWQMIGKLVNIDTDIPMTGKIQDDMIKKVIESVPVYVQRKNLSDVEIRLPAANIFCANTLPPFVDGMSGAQNRRWIFFHTKNNVIPEAESYDKYYWDHIFDSDPQGVFNFALDGLRRLCERQGAYTQSASGQAGVKDWQTKSDEAASHLTDFLQDVSEGEVSHQNNLISVRQDLKIQRKVLWDVFKEHFEGVQSKFKMPSKFAIYKAMTRCGYEVKTLDGVRYFHGIGVEVAPESVI